MTIAERRAFVLHRAGYACEYCKFLLTFAAGIFVEEHIFPTAKGGTFALLNLAAACSSCNGRKYVLTTAIDPISKQEVPLFNPRTDIWTNHFQWSDDFLLIEGITDVGRATIERLDMNHEFTQNFRRLALGRVAVAGTYKLYSPVTNRNPTP